MEKWYQLDNAAKVFPSVTSERNSSVFRVAAILKTEVKPEALKEAIKITLLRYPMFTVQLRKGVFWNYLDDNQKELKIEEEQDFPCSTIHTEQNNGYLFRVLYYKKRIAVEMFHALTDGNGAIEFLKTLLYYYFKNNGNSFTVGSGILTAESTNSLAEAEDSFQRYYKPCYVETTENQKAYHIKGMPFNTPGTNVTHGVVSAAALNALAKKENVTITALLTGILIYAIHQTRVQYDRKNQPIVVAVPVNLRKAFPSKTLRNFFGVVNIGVFVEKETTISSIIKRCNSMLVHKTSKEHLQNLIYNYVSLERKKSAYFVPLFLKSYFMNIGFQKLGENKKTISMSNLGRVNFPPEMADEIEALETIMYPTKNSPLNCSLCTVGDRMTITFARNIVDVDILQFFFTYLSKELELDVEIYSNDWGVLDD
ncbi:alcohol acetyltransferase [Brochothrix thermosphacta]|uniref:Alcohol acetyltransferase n=1 Tax=Brochothrix thermosphacta TaxID=2756 RepID=A0A2X0QRG6_BROTH|nr:alcohol acetyltransferase [Brochothrix thermosphacta]SPP30904.1 Alcohol acetyltransferase [Brochothrix thermosphacta]